MVDEVALATTPFPHVEVHFVCFGVENGLIAQRLRDVLSHRLRLTMRAQISQCSLDVELREPFGRVEPPRGPGAGGDDQATGLKFAKRLPVDLQAEDGGLADVLLGHEDLIETDLLVRGASDRVVHLKKQALPHEVLEVLPFDVAHHSFDVIVTSRVEHLPIAETSHGPLGVGINAKDGDLAVFYHAGRLEESAVAPQGQD